MVLRLRCYFWAEHDTKVTLTTTAAKWINLASNNEEHTAKHRHKKGPKIEFLRSFSLLFSPAFSAIGYVKCVSLCNSCHILGYPNNEKKRLVYLGGTIPVVYEGTVMLKV